MNYDKLAQNALLINGASEGLELINSIILDTIDVAETAGSAVKYAKEVLEAQDGDEREMAFKKIIAAAAVLAKELNPTLPLPEDPNEIAALIDDGFTRVKTAYQYAAGILSNPEEAAEKIIERGEVRLISFLDKVCDSGLVNKIATEGLVKAAYLIPKIGPIVGPYAEQLKPQISAILSQIEPVVKNVVKEGIHAVAETAKMASRQVIGVVKDYAKNLKKRIEIVAAFV